MSEDQPFTGKQSEQLNASLKRRDAKRGTPPTMTLRVSHFGEQILSKRTGPMSPSPCPVVKIASRCSLGA